MKIKATKGRTEIDEAQLINYLKATGHRVGLLFNPSTSSGRRFGTPSLEHLRRVV
ncbi:MAG: hypothetical protein KKC71_04185 [Chloroflexi bacterium]|nr:hypothetical protein [Chloroflexota bacterium]